MASATTSSAMAATSSTAPRRPAGLVGFVASFQPMKLIPRAAKLSASRHTTCLQVRASMKETAMAGLATAALAAALVVPDIAEAAQPGFSPSIKNFLISIAVGGMALLGAVIAVANFDPANRS